MLISTTTNLQHYRAKIVNNQIECLEEPIYHGNPIDAKGSLVTHDWGIDFTDFVYENSKMFTTIYLINNNKLGLEAEFLEVFITRKSENAIYTLGQRCYYSVQGHKFRRERPSLCCVCNGDFTENFA